MGIEPMRYLLFLANFQQLTFYSCIATDRLRTIPNTLQSFGQKVGITVR